MRSDGDHQGDHHREDDDDPDGDHDNLLSAHPASLGSGQFSFFLLRHKTSQLPILIDRLSSSHLILIMGYYSPVYYFI